jgi:glutamate racemase
VPVIKTASTISKTKQFVVLSTEFTANSEYQKNLIKQWASDCHVENLGSTKLVPLIEDGKTHTEEVIAELHRLLDPLKDTAYDVVALGCTHYPFLRRALSEVVKSGVQILDSGDAIARQVQRILEQNNIANVDSGTLTYQTTGDQQKVSKVFKLLLEKDIVVTHVTV